MPDSKITALTSISTSTDPANDPLVIVDVSDTSMAATGTTKKVTLNQLLGASGTATLASATITGDLTVDTSTLKVDSANNRVGIGTASPTVDLEVGDGTGTRTLKISGATNIFDIGFGSLRGGSTYGDVRLWTDRFRVYNAAGTQIIKNISGTNGDETWYDGAGGTRMTLNSTGLGVGVSPAFKLQVVGTSGSLVDFCGSGVAGLQTLVRLRTATGNTNGLLIQGNVSNDEMYINNFYNAALSFGTNNIERLRIDSSGNVGIGVTPSYKLHVNGRVSYSTGIGEGADLTLSSTGTQVQHGISSTWTSQNFYTGGISRVVMKANGQVRFVPLAADPAGAEAGDVYYNSTSNKLKCYNGTTWNDLF